MRIPELAWLPLLVIVSCGSGDDGGSGGAKGSGGSSAQAGSCAALAKTWCAKAAACTAGDKCTLIRPGSTETHDTEKMCVDFYAYMGCQNAPTDPAWASACQQALGAAACDGQSGLDYPSACDW